MQNLPPFSTLRAFEAAARHLSFKDAADELYVTPSSVSHQIKKLELWLGTKLFFRLHRRIDLTADGRHYHSFIATALNNISDGTALVKRNSKRRAATRQLTIGANGGFIDCWLNSRVGLFKEFAPEIELNFVYGDDIATYRNYDSDVAIIYSTVAPTVSGTTVLGRYREFVVCSPELKIDGRRLKLLSDLEQLTLLHEQDFLSWKNWLEEFGVDNVDPMSGPIYHNTKSILSRVETGGGIALADILVAGDALLRGNLVKPLPLSRLSDWTTYLIPLRPKADSDDIAIFSDWLIKTMHVHEVEMRVFESASTFPNTWPLKCP